MWTLLFLASYNKKGMVLRFRAIWTKWKLASVSIPALSRNHQPNFIAPEKNEISPVTFYLRASAEALESTLVNRFYWLLPVFIYLCALFVTQNYKVQLRHRSKQFTSTNVSLGRRIFSKQSRPQRYKELDIRLMPLMHVKRTQATCQRQTDAEKWISLLKC